MGQQPSSDPHSQQNINIDKSSVEGQVGTAGHDLFQIQGAGNWVIKLAFNLFGKRESSPRQKYNKNRQILLDRVRHDWVEAILDSPLYANILELDLEERLDVINHPRNIAWETPEQTRRILPPGTKVIDVFDQMGAGRKLLILGDPGSGKTTSLLKLTRELIERDKGTFDQQIPVFFHLSSWAKWAKKSQPFADWLIQALKTEYNIDRRIGKAWVNEQKMLLLLDGLDEVRAGDRKLCISILNQFICEHGQTEIVICSRNQDYQYLSHRLCFQNAIYIKPLTRHKINDYFDDAGAELAAVKTLLQKDHTLQELATTPLMLSIITLAFQGRRAVEELPRINSVEELRKHVFNAYIKRMFYRRRHDNQRNLEQPYSEKKAKSWLIWLAQRMKQEEQTIFFIEQMQPSLLQTRCQKWIYCAGVMLLSALSLWLIISIAMIIERQNGLVIERCFAGLFIGLYRALKDKIEPVEALGLSWENVSMAWKNVLIPRIKWFLLLGFIFVSLSGLMILIQTGQLINYILGLMIIAPVVYLCIIGIPGTILGLIYLLGVGLRGKPKDKTEIPNQGIWQSLYNTFWFALIGVAFFSLICIPIGWGLGRPINGLATGLASGLSVGLFPGLVCIQHLMLRLILYFSSSIPWVYYRFLDYAEERIFLQKVGGGYKFFNNLLRDHFASLEEKKETKT